MTYTLRLLPVLVIGFLGLAGCNEPPADDPTVDTGEALDNENVVLSEDAWIDLMDGETFGGWHAYNRDALPGKWRIDDGAFHFDPEADGEGGDIVTDETFGSFEMTWSWKISECGNSGVFYHVAESDDYDTTWQTGPEYQILDNTCHPDAENGLDRTAGANYALHAPSEDAARPAGEWNEARLVVDDGRVEHWLNGTKVVEYELGSADWQERVAASKFNEMPGYGIQGEGHIALQDHGDAVWYRDIRIRRL